jgi:GNAT superfamily N-acetyltransferase
MGSVRCAVELPPFSPTLVSEVTELAVTVFGTVDRSDMKWRLTNLAEPSLVVASSRSELVGFKFGHALSSKRYQSWLGGVRASARRQGIGRRLMQLQHEWVAARGFTSIETSATPDNTGMLALNRESGFRVIGRYDRGGKPRVILYKEFRDS